jgi:hypothetical protein
VLAAWLAPASVSAQGARELFESGSVALEEGRFPEARDLLTGSFELHPHRATAFNLIVALRGTEEPVRAVELCDRLLGGELGELPAERRTQAETICNGVRDDVARMFVGGEGADRIEVRVGGEPRGDIGPDLPPLAVALDPGRHVVVGTAPGCAPDERVVELDAGEIARVALLLVPLAQDGESEIPSGANGDWPVWLGVIGAAVLVGAAIAIGVATHETSIPLPPTATDLYPDGVVTLAPRWP